MRPGQALSRITRLAGAAVLTSWSIALSACTGAPAPAAAPAPSPTRDAPAAPTAPGLRLPHARPYVPRGRRDPFEPIAAPRRREAGPPRSSVTRARLTAIARGAGGAMALVETPDGMGHILKLGEKLDEGRLIEIRHDSVVFDVSPGMDAQPERIVLHLEPAS